jgi:hypothetical protein
MTRLSTTIFGLVAAVSLIVMIIIGGRDLPRAAVAAMKNDNPNPQPVRTIEDLDLDPETRIQFYNWINEESKKYNFGPSGFEDFDDYDEPYGELLDRLTDDGEDDEKLPDPVLMAAIAYAIDQTHGTDILGEFYDDDRLPAQQVNDAAKKLVDSDSFRKEVVGKIREALEEAEEVTVDDIGAYTSMMWMVPDGFEDRPAITIADSNHDGGHCLTIKWDNGDILKLRIECGYQPINISWKKETPPPSETTPSTTTTQPPTETTPTETTTVVTSLEPKNTLQAVNVDSDPDNGRGNGSNPANTGLTPQPTWTTTSSQTTTKATETPSTATQAPTTAQAPPATVKHDDKSYVVDSGPTDYRPQQEVAGDTPEDAAVYNDPVVSGTAPSGGGDFANRY